MTQHSAKTEKKLTVLVLDDQPKWAELVKFILEKELGISPAVASSGQQALDLLAASPVDVVVSDINMPGMNGMQFLQRAGPMFPGTKFILMTADNVTDVMSEECIARGALGVVSKDEIDLNLLKLLRDLQVSDSLLRTCQ
jgi:CheY-like chemotaxis protein